MDWKQNETLLPPPAEEGSLFARIRKGYDCGDAVLDHVPLATLRQVAFKGNAHLLPQLQDSTPEWVDWEKIRKAQQFHRSHYYYFLVGLTMSLLNGFTIARFSEVLVIAGYTSSLAMTYRRFQSTK